jgi:hypothetical protein
MPIMMMMNMIIITLIRSSAYERGMSRCIGSLPDPSLGGPVACSGILSYLSKMNYLHINHEDTYLDELVGAVVAFFGVCESFVSPGVEPIAATPWVVF